MNPSQFFSALRARFGLFAVALTATVVTATVISLIMPRIYRATSAVVIDTRQEQSLNNSLNALFSPQERAAYIQTQVDIITSEKVAHDVVERLGIANKPDTRADFAELGAGSGTIEDWLADRLLRNLEVETSQSAVINISYMADDPAYSAKVANTFATAYIDRVLELRVEPTRHAAVWFDEQLKTLRANLEESQAKLTEFQQRHGIVSTDERLDVGHAQLAELSSQMVRAREENITLRSRQRQAELLRELGLSMENLPDSQADSLIRDLRRDVEDGEVRLGQLASQYGVNHPLYKRQLAENRSREQRLRAEIDRMVEVSETRVDRGQEREGEIRSSLAAQRDELLQLKESRDKLSLLERNVQTAQNAYDTVMQRYLVSQVESRASQTNVALLNPAVAPRIPHRPNIVLNIVLSFVVGTMLGTGIVVLLELSDRRIRSVADLQYGLEVPLLGELSAWKPPERLLLASPGGGPRSLPGPD
jgi:chain length determinant protein EpsF